MNIPIPVNLFQAAYNLLGQMPTSSGAYPVMLVMKQAFEVAIADEQAAQDAARAKAEAAPADEPENILEMLEARKEKANADAGN